MMGHKLVYYTHEEEFYFKDPREGDIFKPTTEDKLKTLLSLYILECAEQLTPKLSDSCHHNVHLRIKEASVLALQVECWT